MRFLVNLPIETRALAFIVDTSQSPAFAKTYFPVNVCAPCSWRRPRHVGHAHAPCGAHTPT